MSDVYTFSGRSSIFGATGAGTTVTCSFCREDNKTVVADGYCVDCDDYLCTTCFNIHKKTRVTLNHRLLNKTSMPPCSVPESERLRKTISTMCPTHHDKPAEFFCKSHDYLGCYSCFVMDHRACTAVESISGKADGLLEGKEYTDFMADLEAMQRSSKDVIEWSKANISKAKICLSNVLDSMKKFRKEINDSIDAIEIELKTQAEQIKKEDTKSMQTIILQAESCLKDTLRIQAGLKSLERKKRVCEMYISMLKSGKEMQSTKQVLDEAKMKNSVRLYQFSANTVLKETLKQSGILGQILIDDGGPRSTSMTTPTAGTSGFGVGQTGKGYQPFTQLSATSVVASKTLTMNYGGTQTFQPSVQSYGSAQQAFGSAQQSLGSTPPFVFGQNTHLSGNPVFGGSYGNASSFGNASGYSLG